MKYYNSPRWSGEILDCSMPMTFDTYSHCSYKCLYCFSYYQKTHTLTEGKDYQSAAARWVNTDKVKRLFQLDDNIGNTQKQFFDYIKDRKVMQWGELSDPFDNFEKNNGITLELLKFFKEKNYPLCFSTKGTWWTKDDRYLKLIKGQKNWNFKISIINLNPERAKLIEMGVDSPQERLEAIKRIAELDCGGVTLRLRPIIIGHTDRDNEYLDLIKQAAENGATAISTEFYCVDIRADENLKNVYKKIGDVVEYDVLSFYKANSVSTGYMRLNRKIKRPIIKKMYDLCNKLGMRFYVSDADFKELCHNGSCCGLPEDWNYSRGQFTEALLIAKREGVVEFSDISNHLETYKKFNWIRACAFNTGTAIDKARRSKQTMYDYIREMWNNPNSSKSPYKYFGGILFPIKLDEDKNIIYEYRGDKNV